MPTRIPLPGNMIDTLMKGVDTGSAFYSRAMQPILEREKQKQLNEHFKQQMALHNAAAARNAQLFPYRLQELKDRHAAAEFDKNMMQRLLSGEAPQESMPTMPTGEGMGVFSPEGLEDVQKNTHKNNGLNLEALRQDPMFRGWYKHKFGFDPLATQAQTPEEKQAGALDLFQRKEDIKKQNKGGDVPTNSILTQNQNAIHGIDTVLPMLDEIINNPKSVYGATDFSPSKKAAYNAKTSGMIDTLVAAQSLPKVQASIDLVSEQIRRHTNESTDAYIKRLKDLRKDLINRRGRSQSVLQNRKVNTAPLEDFSSMSDDELRKIAGGG